MAINDWLSNNSGALLAASAGLLGGRTGNEQAAMGLQGFGNAMAATKQKNKTMEFLKQVNPELAQAVEAGALSPLDAYKTHVEAQKPKNNFTTVGKNLYNYETGEWVSPPAGMQEASEYGLVPVWGQNAAGETVLGQLSKNGQFQQTQMPEGFQPTPGITNLDLGTSIMSRNSKTGGVVAQTPKDLAGAEMQKELGTAQGKNVAAAPGNLQAGQNALTIIDSIRTDPYKTRGTGFSSYGNSVRGTGGYDFQNKVDQAKSGAFLTAIDQLRGMGALSNTEGDTATKAVTRLNTATSEPAFDAALSDYEAIVKQGIAKADAIMAGQGGQAQMPAQGTPGQTKSGVSWSIE